MGLLEIQSEREVYIGPRQVYIIEITGYGGGKNMDRLGAVLGFYYACLRAFHGVLGHRQAVNSNSDLMGLEWL